MDTSKGGRKSRDPVTSCGLFNWRPEWMQRFACRKYYLVLYALIGIVQGMTFSYLTVVLSTIERRFGLKSKEAAWIYSGNEISQIFFIVFLPFVGRVKKRPLFMSVATVVAAIGLFIIALPHFTGDQNYLIVASNENSKADDVAVCHPNEPRDEHCDGDHSYKDWTSMWVVFFGIFLLGIATSFYFSFGLPYVDDNSERDDSPFFLSLVMAARTVGPAFGYMLGSAMLTIYADPNNKPEGLTDSSPNWIGAWWIGFFIIGAMLAAVSPWLAFFPERLPDEGTDAVQIAKERENEQEPQTAREWVDELVTVSKRLFSKPIFVLNLASSTVFLLGVIGYFTFIPKYFEYHFRQKAATVGATGGLSQSVSSASGILISGIVMKKFRLGARPLAAWCCIADVVFISAFVVIAVMSCPPLTMYGQKGQSGLVQVDNLNCNTDCDCRGVNYQPICSRDGHMNFFSPCHAGCRLVNRTAIEGKVKEKKFYWDCSCIETYAASSPGFKIEKPWWKEIEKQEVETVDGLPNPIVAFPAEQEENSGFFSAAVDGYCPVDCQVQFYSLLCFMFIAGLIGATTRLPNTMLSLRTIDKRDKAASFTLTLSVLSLFAILPSPLIIGAVIDETCVVWGTKCGQQTNCLVYDIDKMRIYLAIFPAVCIFVALLFDVSVWYYAKDLSIYDDDDDVTATASSSNVDAEKTTTSEVNDNDDSDGKDDMKMIDLN